MITIVDYGVGNLFSIKNMLKKAGFDAKLASDAASIETAAHGDRATRATRTAYRHV